jgi:nitroreductase
MVRVGALSLTPPIVHSPRPVGTFDPPRALHGERIVATVSVSLVDADARVVVEAATRAPSVLNTQPWRWKVAEDAESGTVFELSADSARVLRVTDPLGRFLVISCGAGLFNARLALRTMGYEPLVRLSPDPHEPRLLARVTATPGRPATQEERWLFGAIPERHTNRGPFHQRVMGSGLVHRIVDAAAAEGAVLTVLDASAARRVLEIADEAAREIGRDGRRHDELSSWVHPRPAPDGIPAQAIGPPVAGGSHAVREFPIDSDLAPATYEPEPTIAVLSTYGDSRTDWMRAGQALQRVLLEATLDGVQASFRNEPLEMLGHRWRVRDATTGFGHPQMVMRLGYGDPTFSSPRRPVDEVLQRR